MSCATLFATLSLFDATTVAAGKPFAISAAKFGPEIIAILFFGNIEFTISLGNFKLFISIPFEQQTNNVFGPTSFFSFNKLVDKYNASIDGEIYLKVSGTYVGGSENTIRARDIEVIEPSKMIENLDTTPLRISVGEEKLDKKNLVLLKELLEKFPGLSSVELEVNSKSGSKLLELKEIKVKKTNQLKNEISTLLAK